MNLAALLETGQSFPDRPEMQALRFVKGLDYLVIESVDAEKSRMELVMKDKKQNILRVLLSSIN